MPHLWDKHLPTLINLIINPLEELALLTNLKLNPNSKQNEQTTNLNVQTQVNKMNKKHNEQIQLALHLPSNWDTYRTFSLDCDLSRKPLARAVRKFRPINKTRYDDPGKPMKPTSFTVKNLGGNFPEKQFTIVKRSFRFSTKPLSLDSTIPVDELTVETFYHFIIF